MGNLDGRLRVLEESARQMQVKRGGLIDVAEQMKQRSRAILAGVPNEELPPAPDPALIEELYRCGSVVETEEAAAWVKARLLGGEHAPA